MRRLRGNQAPLQDPISPWAEQENQRKQAYWKNNMLKKLIQNTVFLQAR